MISILGFPLRGLYTIVGISILGFPLRVLHGYHSRVRLKASVVAEIGSSVKFGFLGGGLCVFRDVKTWIG